MKFTTRMPEPDQELRTTASPAHNGITIRTVYRADGGAKATPFTDEIRDMLLSTSDGLVVSVGAALYDAFTFWGRKTYKSGVDVAIGQSLRVRTIDPWSIGGPETLEIQGNIQVDGTSFSSINVVAGQDLNAVRNLAVGGYAVITGSVHSGSLATGTAALGNTSIVGTLGVSGAVTIGGNVSMARAKKLTVDVITVNAGETLAVDASVQIGGNFAVTGTTYLAAIHGTTLDLLTSLSMNSNTVIDGNRNGFFNNINFGSDGLSTINSSGDAKLNSFVLFSRPDIGIFSSGDAVFNNLRIQALTVNNHYGISNGGAIAGTSLSLVRPDGALYSVLTIGNGDTAASAVLKQVTVGPRIVIDSATNGTFNSVTIGSTQCGITNTGISVASGLTIRNGANIVTAVDINDNVTANDLTVNGNAKYFTRPKFTKSFYGATTGDTYSHKSFRLAINGTVITHVDSVYSVDILDVDVYPDTTNYPKPGVPWPPAPTESKVFVLKGKVKVDNPESTAYTDGAIEIGKLNLNALIQGDNPALQVISSTGKIHEYFADLTMQSWPVRAVGVLISSTDENNGSLTLRSGDYSSLYPTSMLKDTFPSKTSFSGVWIIIEFEVKFTQIG